MISCTNIVSCVNMRNSAFDLRLYYWDSGSHPSWESEERGFGGRWDKIRWRLNKAENKYHDAQNFIDRPPPSIDLSPWNHGDHYLLSNCNSGSNRFWGSRLESNIKFWSLRKLELNEIWAYSSTNHPCKHAMQITEFYPIWKISPEIKFLP